MRAKEGIVIAVIILLFIVVGVSVGVTGASNGGNNFVRLEVNPIIEFIAKKDQIVSIRGVNEEGQILLTDEDFLGLSMKEGVTKYLSLCAQMGFLDVDKVNNTLKMTAISGITQEDDIIVFRAARKFFQDNEIMAVIIQNDNDMEVLAEAKKTSSSADKVALVKSARELFPEKTEKELYKIGGRKLIELIRDGQEASMQEPTVEDVANKSRLIDFNRVKYEEHREKITNESQRKFAEEFSDFQKYNLKAYEAEYSKFRENWEEERNKA